MAYFPTFLLSDRGAPRMLVDSSVVAPHCGKCRQMMPFVKELSEEFPETTFAKFDTTGKKEASYAESCRRGCQPGTGNRNRRSVVQATLKVVLP